MKRKLNPSNNHKSGSKSAYQDKFVLKSIFGENPKKIDASQVKNSDNIHLKTRHTRHEDARGSSTERYESSTGSMSQSNDEKSSTASESTLSVKSNTARRRSFWIYWERFYVVNNKLKRLKKVRLGLGQDDFTLLQYQLYCSNILKLKDIGDKDFEMPKTSTCKLKNSVYIVLQRYLTYPGMLRLYIFKYFNTYMDVPTSLLKRFLNLELLHADASNTNGLDTKHGKQMEKPKITSVRMSPTVTLRNVEMTSEQRRAFCNSRDVWLNRFKIEHLYGPVLSELPSTKGNNKIRSLFLLACLKANMSAKLLAEIALAQYKHNIALNDLIRNTSAFNDLVENLEISKYLKNEPDTFKKRRLSVQPQRLSYTNFDPETSEISAATKLQVFYRKRLARKLRAVQVIENWWEPYRVENLETRAVFQQHLDELSGNAALLKYHCKDVQQSYINLYHLQIAFNHNLNGETIADEEYGGVVVREVLDEYEGSQNSESIVANIKNGIRIKHSYMFWICLMAWFFIPAVFFVILRLIPFFSFFKLATVSPYIFVMFHCLSFCFRSATIRVVQNVVMTITLMYIMQVHLDIYSCFRINWIIFLVAMPLKRLWYLLFILIVCFELLFLATTSGSVIFGCCLYDLYVFLTLKAETESKHAVNIIINRLLTNFLFIILGLILINNHLVCFGVQIV